MKTRLANGIAALIIGCFSISCAHMGDRWLVGSNAFEAQNQIMLVRAAPASFGYRRLVDQTKVHPDLGIFVEQQGLPNFLAETSTKDRHYFILYYLGKKQAYACRSVSSYSREVEFTGPYPITPREFRLLNGFQHHSKRKMLQKTPTT